LLRESPDVITRFARTLTRGSALLCDVEYFDDETCRLEPIENPFGPKVLPMDPRRFPMDGWA